MFRVVLEELGFGLIESGGLTLGVFCVGEITPWWVDHGHTPVPGKAPVLERTTIPAVREM